MIMMISFSFCFHSQNNSLAFHTFLYTPLEMDSALIQPSATTSIIPKGKEKKNVSPIVNLTSLYLFCRLK